MSVLEWAGRKIAPEKKAVKGRARRRGYPIHMYVGRNGSGKSLAACFDTIPDLDAGTPVLSTVRLVDYRNPRPCDDLACQDQLHGQEGHLAAHPAWVPFTSWPQFLAFTDGVALLDEITGVADSFDSASLPGAVANKLAQLRRDKVVVRITGLNFIRANKRIREAVNAVTRCQSYMPVTVENEGEGTLWRQRRLAVWRTYDAQSLPVDDHTDSAYESADLLVKSRLWIPGSPASQVYDSMAPILSVGSVTDAGRCAYCAGTRRAQECSCSDYQEEKASRRGSRAQAPAPSTGAPGRTLLLAAAAEGRLS